MRPLRLEMEGFGAFRAPTVIDFTDIELVALVGRTGSGKSTIIDALTFALYGSVARYDDERAVAPVINQTSTRARVRLDFQLGADRFTAVRLVQRTKTGATTKEARLERGDEVLASDARSMTAAVCERLGLDAAQFNRTVVLPQGRFADFLHDKPADRQSTLRSLLGLGVYQAIASAARRRAAALRNQVDALRPELDDVDTSDERRQALVDRQLAVGAARATFIAALGELAVSASEVRALEERLATTDERLALLADVAVPDGLPVLDRQLTESAQRLADATRDVATARARLRLADAAISAGPDIVRCTTQLTALRDARAAMEEHAATVARLTAAQAVLALAEVAARDAAGAQLALDERAIACRQIAAERRDAVEAGPQPTQVTLWHSARTRHRVAVAELETAMAAAATASGALEPLRQAVLTTTAAEERAREARDDVRQRAGAAGFASLIHVGAPCPLCLQRVDELPEHHVDAELAAADEAQLEASAAAGRARRAVAAAEQAATALAATVDADRRAILAMEADLQGVADDEGLRAMLDVATELRRDLDRAAVAAREADAEASAHRTRPEHVATLAAATAAEVDVAGLQALEASHRTRGESLSSAVVGLPVEAELEASIAEAGHRADERRSAADALTATERAQSDAMAAQAAAEGALAAATRALHATRDRLATLGPPALAGERIVAAWEAVVTWADDQRDELLTARTATAAEHVVQSARRDAVEQRGRAVAVDVLGSGAGELPVLRDRLAQAETAAAAELAAFDERRQRLLALAERVAGLDADRAVAERLGLLLRSDGFEAWLMEAALVELVDAASERLRELSSGQFSLELVERDFMVRDHANADELRSARTLSGGETFLASLALALALAEATSELAPDGSPALDSIFLDEGFGSLDPSTLDVVASAIEELGTSGRMVAVVTHIRELADRMPVRLEVTKTASTSSVERVDA